MTLLNVSKRSAILFKLSLAFIFLLNYCSEAKSTDRPISFFWNRYRYFQKKFTNICSAAAIQFATDTDIPKCDDWLSHHANQLPRWPYKNHDIHSRILF